MPDQVTSLNFIPLGGLGEIGLNMMVIEQGPDIIVIDCGLMFPGDFLPGVDYVIPDFSYLLDKADRIKGIILTHGHEDHIGALPYFLTRVPAPIYATPLTLGLVHEKLLEFGLVKSVETHPIAPGDHIRLGGFEIEPIRVSHSIADCIGLAIKTDVGVIIHTGDFKLDPTPIDGQRVDLPAFARYGDQGVMALLSDSTNVEREGFTPSERQIGKAFREILENALGRVIIAMFASNIHRMQQVFDSAADTGRKVVLLGRSMESICRIARGLGYLKVPDGTLVGPGALKQLDDAEVVILTTGSQGEPLSGLARMARDEHKHASIVPGDTVVLSSRFIPGNERAIDYLINEFYRRGAEVIYEKVSDIHVSGHASREELKLMIALVRPEYFIPIHGEYRHLLKHAQLAETMGVAPARVLVAEDGDVVTFDKVGGEIVGRVDTGQQVVHGPCVADSEDEVLQERRKLGHEGVLVAVATIRSAARQLVSPIRLESRGVFYDDDAPDALIPAAATAEQRLSTFLREGKSRLELQVELAAGLKRYFKKQLLRFPLVTAIVIDLDDEKGEKVKR